jgi:Protein kinase domain/RWD domain
MPGGRFDALQTDDSSDSDADVAEADQNGGSGNGTNGGNSLLSRRDKDGSNDQDDQVVIPPYEDLSSSRADEEMVLQAIYGDDYHSEVGAWGQKKLFVKVRPPDLEPKQIGCGATVSAQLSKRYPYVAPKIELKDVRGLSKEAEELLVQNLNERAYGLAAVGSVVVCELVQVTEAFLFEHNVDPSMSAWEQMKAREAKEQAEKEALKMEKEKRIKFLMDADSEQAAVFSLGGSVVSPRSTEGDFHGLSAPHHIERELTRQREAIEAANKQRTKNDRGLLVARTSSIGTSNDGDDEDDDFDGDDDGPPAAFYGSSRYQTDFIELGVLGRGGGGEVVKVRNRLDRRTYAIKKILLESELGKNAKLGEMQNRKLRREVTTISRMTHKNIVRYYQAWVEGGGNASTLDDDLSAHNGDEIVGNAEDTADLLKDPLESASENDGEEVKQGWWSKPPNEIQDLTTRQEKSEGRSQTDTSSHVPSAPSSSSSSWSEEDSAVNSSPTAANEDEMLATGINLDNQIYQDLFKQSRGLDATSSTDDRIDKQNGDNDETSSMWDESSVKVDGSKKQSPLHSNGILQHNVEKLN